MVNFGDTLRKGLKFSIDPKRWIPIFVLDSASLGIFLTIFILNMDTIMGTAVGLEANAFAYASFAGIIATFVVGIFIWYIARICIMGALVHQSVRPKEIEKSFRISIRRLHKILVATTIVGLISGILGSVPLFGWIISILVGLAFFFVIQGIILEDLGVISTLKYSWKIFRKDPFDVFVSWFLIAVITILIFGVLALPLLLSFVGVFMNLFLNPSAVDSGAVFALFSVFVQENLAQIVVTGLLAVLGMGISQVFAIKAQTEFYNHFKAKRPSTLKAFKDKKGNFF